MISFISKQISKVFGTKYDRDIKALLPLVTQANQHFASYASLSNDALRQKTLEFRTRIAEHLAGIDADITTLRQEAQNSTSMTRKEQLFEEIDAFVKERDKHLEVVLREIMPEAFAVVKETARRLKDNAELRVTATDHDRMLAAKKTTAERGAYVRIEGNEAIWKNQWLAAGSPITWNMLHYDVQLIGGMVLHDGKIAEMQTGEGKTLVATLPAYLNGLGGNVHIVTVNDYLARRDSQWKGPLFEFLFLTCDCIDLHRPNSAERRTAYGCDIVYGTNNEFGFDYLRDNMVSNPDELVQGKHHFAMVDEVDSVLIDDARTPLIISGPIENDTDHEMYGAFKPVVEQLYEAQRKLVTNFLTDAKRQFAAGDMGVEEGQGGLALFRAHRGLPRYRPTIKFLSEMGVKTTMQKVEDHYMQEQSKNMHLADAELYFTIEEKNNSVELTNKGNAFLSKLVKDDNFFIMPDITNDMMQLQANKTLSDDEKIIAREQLTQDFSLKSRRLHCVQQLLKAYSLFEKEKDYILMEGDVKIVDESTGRIMEGRRWSDGLHQAVEAKEGVHINEATQTFATVTLQNYFRMYHKLAGMTGTAETEAEEFWTIYKLEVVAIPTNQAVTRKDDDDLVYKSTRAKFNAVAVEIERLREAGRPVLVGTTSVNLSELLSRTLSQRGIPHNVLNAKQHAQEAQIVADAGLAGAVTIATNMAGRGTDIKLGAGVKEAGGLAIIGTERHDSRRVDRQLRGRAGRQGDPGSSQFFVSLEDDLMRKFGSERLAGWMDKMGYDENEVIQHSMVSNSIERSQKKVEENNFGVRKRLLEYDDAMNIQRETIYKKRNNALFGERVSVDINNMFCDLADELVQLHRPTSDFEGFQADSHQYFGIEPDITAAEFKSNKPNELSLRYQRQVLKHYRQKMDGIAEQVMPIIVEVHKHEGDKYTNIAIPYAYGIKQLQVVVPMAATIAAQGKTLPIEIEKGITLALIDQSWKEHLRNMDDLKETVQTASFEQKDPLVKYKIEAFSMFKGLMGVINREVVSFLSQGKVNVSGEDDIQEAEIAQRQEYYTNEEREAMAAQQANQQNRQSQNQQQQAPRAPQAPIRNEIKVGRNDACPCGSGKKFKNCHGK